MNLLEETRPRLKLSSASQFEAMFREYYPSLCRFAYAYLMNQQQAEDVVQDVFVSMWEGRKSLDENLSVRHYLFASVKYACFDLFKHLKIVDKHMDKLSEAIQFSGISEYEENENRVNELLNIIESLPEQQKQALKLKLIEGMNYRQIGENMGISEGTVHTHIKRAYRMIRKTSLFLFLFFK